MAKLEVSSKRVMLRNNVTGFPQETYLELSQGTIVLKVPQGSNAILVKNLYLSCDPYMHYCMQKCEDDDNFKFFKPGSVSILLSIISNCLFGIKNSKSFM